MLRIEHDAWIHLTPTRPIRLFAVTSTAGFTCCTFHDEPRFRASEESPSQMVRQVYPSTPSALRSKPAATTASADFSLRFAPSPFQAQGEISPGKNAILPRTTAGFTLPPFDHKSFAICCPLALVGIALYPVLVHRLAVSIHASSPHSVTLMQLRFTSFAVVSLRWDFHPQDCAHAGRTTKTPPAPKRRRGFVYWVFSAYRD
jgi:hypothetical protein